MMSQDSEDDEEDEMKLPFKSKRLISGLEHLANRKVGTISLAGLCYARTIRDFISFTYLPDSAYNLLTYKPTTFYLLCQMPLIMCGEGKKNFEISSSILKSVLCILTTYFRYFQ